MKTQKAIKVTSESKGIRYDVYVEDCDNNAYDTEMQNLNTLEDLPKLTYHLKTVERYCFSTLKEKLLMYQNKQKSFLTI